MPTKRTSRPRYTNATTRRIFNVLVDRGDADDVAHHHRQMGRRPRVYERQARAENITIPIFVVVADDV
jgi:hypothetical protein